MMPAPRSEIDGTTDPEHLAPVIPLVPLVPPVPAELAGPPPPTLERGHAPSRLHRPSTWPPWPLGWPSTCPVFQGL